MIMAQYDSFSIRVSGSNTNHSATFYKDKLLYGLDFARFSMNAEISEEEYGSDGYLTSSSSNGGISINVFMPRIGYKMPAKSMGRVNTYNQIEGYLVIPMVKGTGDVDISEFDDEIKDALSLFGIKISHAVEYEFSEQLSLTASVGFNLIFWDFSTESTNQSSYYAGNGYYYNVTETSKQELSVNLGYTYTMLALHYQLKN